jgi:hypothetical protein
LVVDRVQLLPPARHGRMAGSAFSSSRVFNRVFNRVFSHVFCAAPLGPSCSGDVYMMPLADRERSK